MMKAIRIVLWLMLMSPALFCQGFLGVNGTAIVDDAGQPYMLRGYGLGGWLVPEGYMLHTPGYGSPTDIRNKIADLLGEQDTEEFYRRYRANYVNEQDIQQIADWGFNSIRLPFHYDQFYDTATQTFRDLGFNIVDSLLSWCRPRGIYVILDMHCAPGGQNNGNISDSDGVLARLWTEPANQDLAIHIWKEIARRYVNETLIAGYDIINEPVLPDGFTNQPLRDFYVRAVGEIRTIDTNHIVFIEGNWYATNFDLLTPPFDSKMVYSFHRYWNSTNTGSIQYLLNMRSQHNTPLWMGESGENSNPWFAETIRDYEQYGIGWCWWAHKKIATTTSPLSAVLLPEYQDILDYWGGSGPRPSQAAARAALFAQAEALKIENCELRPGIIPALLDPNFTQVATPFGNLTVPGAVPAAYYDLGSNGIAYVDAEYKNEAGGGGTVWNQGYAFRNDGVDLEACSDPSGAAYNVGWTAVGERLYYTVDVLEAGTYYIGMRVASQDGNGKFRLLLDGAALGGEVVVPQTGGWQSWTNIQVTDIPLPAGRHQFGILITESGFNINLFTFLRTGGTGIGDPEELSPQGFHLEQNYPNPFNGETRIRFFLPSASRVNLSVYNLLGGLTEELLATEMSPGLHEVTWDGEDTASGIYFLKLTSPLGTRIRTLHLVR